jgi:hypothetical protein
MTAVPEHPGLISSETPTAPHLSRMAWLAEQLVQTADEAPRLCS